MHHKSGILKNRLLFLLFLGDLYAKRDQGFLGNSVLSQTHFYPVLIVGILQQNSGLVPFVHFLEEAFETDLARVQDFCNIVHPLVYFTPLKILHFSDLENYVTFGVLKFEGELEVLDLV